MSYAPVVSVPVPPVLLVPYEQCTPAQVDEYKQSYVDFHGAVCRAVQTSARSLSANV
jgi:hypothetical protein